MKDDLKDAYRAMGTSVKRGWEGMASELGVTMSSLHNRLHGVNGQTIPTVMALEMQTISGRSDFAEAVARLSGGTFVKLPEVAIADNEDLLAKFNAVYAKVGDLSRRYAEAVEDNKICAGEKRDLSKIANELHQATQELLATMFLVYCEEGK